MRIRILAVVAATVLAGGLVLGAHLASGNPAHASTSVGAVHPAAAGTITVPASKTAPAPAAFAPKPAATLINPPATTKYLGVAAPGGGWAPEAAWDQATGVSPDIVEEFIGWGQGLPDVATNWSHGAITLLSWGPTGTTLAAVAAGDWDGTITRLAVQVAAVKIPIAISFAHEMNGNWYPWGTQAATPAQFVAAWRHVHDLFAAAGASNTIWVWSPNVINPMPGVNIAAYWPGNAYVTWAGMVGYWVPAPAGQDTWNTLYGPTEQVIEAFTGDPILITETGAQQGTGKAGRVTSMLAGLKADPRVIGLVYFNYGTAQGKRADWTLQDDPAALAAYRVAAGTIGTVKIP
jgi:mannan endo-1,4-beta-mannosidase